MVTKIKKPNTQVGVRLEPETFKKLDEIAKADYRTPSAVARIAIVEYIERKLKVQAA